MEKQTINIPKQNEQAIQEPQKKEEFLPKKIKEKLSGDTKDITKEIRDIRSKESQISKLEKEKSSLSKEKSNELNELKKTENELLQILSDTLIEQGDKRGRYIDVEMQIKHLEKKQNLSKEEEKKLRELKEEQNELFKKLKKEFKEEYPNLNLESIEYGFPKEISLGYKSEDEKDKDEQSINTKLEEIEELINSDDGFFLETIIFNNRNKIFLEAIKRLQQENSLFNNIKTFKIKNLIRLKDIEQLNNTKKLPDLQIGGSLYLQYTQVTKLPDNLQKIGGSLDLANTQITKLPDNLQEIGGSLDLANTQITKLPDNLQEIGGNLYIEEHLREQANKLKEKGKIKGEIIIV